MVATPVMVYQVALAVAHKVNQPLPILGELRYQGKGTLAATTFLAQTTGRAVAVVLVGLVVMDQADLQETPEQVMPHLLLALQLYTAQVVELEQPQAVQLAQATAVVVAQGAVALQTPVMAAVAVATAAQPEEMVVRVSLFCLFQLQTIQA